MMARRRPPITDAELALGAAINGLMAGITIVEELPEPMDDGERETLDVMKQSLCMAQSVRDAMAAERRGS